VGEVGGGSMKLREGDVTDLRNEYKVLHKEFKDLHLEHDREVGRLENELGTRELKIEELDLVCCSVLQRVAACCGLLRCAILHRVQCAN